MACGARRREGGLRAGGDRPPLRRPLQPRAARRAARGRGGASGDERELLYRLRKTCEGGLVSAQLAEREDELENRLLAERVTFQGEEMPLRNAQAKLAVLPGVRRPRGARRASRRRRARAFNPDRLELLRAGEELAAELLRHRRRGRAQRGGEGHLAARARRARCTRASVELDASYDALRERWFARLLGDERAEVPSSYHTAWMRRLSPLEATYTKDRATEVCLQTLDGARLRPERAAEHQARPRRPAAEVAARLRDRERPAEGRAPDHARAGRSARLPGVPARGRPRAALRRLRPGAAVRLPPHRARPRADRDLLVHRRGDLARAGVARAATSASRPSRRARTPRRRRSSRRCSTAATRRSCGSSSTSGRASPRTAATPTCYERLPHRGDRHPLPPRQLSLRHGRRLLLGRLPARVDPLRAAARAPRRARSAPTGGATRRRASCCASSSARARSRRARRSPARLGFDPLDTKPLLGEIGA